MVLALNAKKAGLDGVEPAQPQRISIDQFLQDIAALKVEPNWATGPGQSKTGAAPLRGGRGANWPVGGRPCRRSGSRPSGTFNGMADSNPRALFRYVADGLNDGLASSSTSSNPGSRVAN